MKEKRKAVVAPCGTHLLVPLTQGKFAKIDFEDEWITQWNWFAGYITGHFRPLRWDSGRMLYMYRELCRPGKGLQVDHINGDSLDNRRSNLRVVTPDQNRFNRKLNINSTTGVRGVTRNGRGFMVKVGHRGYIGTYPTLEEATEARRTAVERHKNREFIGEISRKETA